MTISHLHSSSITEYATNADTDYFVLKGRSIAVANGDPALVADDTVTGRSFTIAGNVVSEGGTGMIVGDQATDTGAADFVKVTSTGNVFGYHGVKLHADGQDLSNAGAILGTGHSGIYFDADDVRVNNSGTVGGVVAGVWAAGEHSTITNSGMISSQQMGIKFLADSGKVINKGTIEADTAIEATGMKEGVTIVNRGILSGNVLLSDESDTLDTRGGQIGYTAYGYGGDDEYFVSSSKDVHIAEWDNGGIDTVHASGTWTLGEEFENLLLIGKKAINATGNADANSISGNNAANRLSGMAGKDEIASNGGDDIMRGGLDGDTFIFETGDGLDRILDFKVGIDEIDLDALKGVTSFKDMMKQHVSENAHDDVVISSGTDTLTLVGVDRADLQSTDFII